MSDADANQSLGERTWPGGWHVRRVAQTGSTNADMVAAAGGGAPHHSVLVADYQTTGRGRLDRSWDAAPGANLLTSLLFRPDVSPDRPIQQYTHMVGLAARAACAKLGATDVDMKWPNDLLVDDRKLAGILAQGDHEFVVVGIGLNVAWAPEEATTLRVVTRNDALEPLDVLAQMLAEIDRLESLTVDSLHREYVKGLSTIGREVRIEMLNGNFVEGRAIDVDGGGRLVVRDSADVTHRIEVGDVIHLRRR
jgi:BirA family transcriptional regulator, biotin operon repressor / biotin---[acetyl-CoA-carboxylase] ligase